MYYFILFGSIKKQKLFECDPKLKCHFLYFSVFVMNWKINAKQKKKCLDKRCHKYIDKLI